MGTRSIVLAAVAVFLFAVGPAAGATMIAEYDALLSSADHQSSTGEKLTTAAEIIRQDRANYHKFGIRDPQDGDDTYFGSASNRTFVEQMLERGNADPDVLQHIVDGNVRVHVAVFRRWERGGNYDYLVVTLLP
jgi:hypothetical protein